MRILLVEDLPTDAELARREIENELGTCEFRRVETREDYLQALEDFQPELIVSDYMLPSFDGMSALLIAFEQIPDVPFIILTGSMNEETAVDCMKAGAWDYVIKEHVKRLGPAVQSALEQRNLRLERQEARKKVERLNKVLMAIRNVNQFIVREKDRERLIQGACDKLVESRGYFSAWILLCRDSGEIAAAAETGLDAKFQALFDSVREYGLPECGRQAEAQEGVLVIADPASACPGCPLRHYFSDRAGMSVPLRYKESVYGVLTVSIPKALADSEEEHLLLQEVADDLGFALYDLEQQEKNEQAEAALREGERKYRLVVENANEGIFIMQDGLYKYVNEYGLRLFACSREELVGSKVLEHVHPEDRDWLEKRIESRLAGDSVQDSVEHRIIDATGKIKWVETRGALTQWEDRPANIGFAVDMSERKKAEAALQKSATRYRELFNSIRDAILVEDTERNIVDCNKAFCEVFGYSLEEIKGQKTHAMYADPEEFQCMGQELRKQKDEQGFVYTIHYQKKSGETFPGETNVFYLRDTGDKISGFIGVIRDVSLREQQAAEQKRLEEQLRQSQKLESVGRLAGGVAHDFNNLLTTIIGNSEMALMELAKDDPHYEIFEEIKGVGERAARLTRQLLAFSRKQILQPEILDLNVVLNDMHKMLKRLIGEHIELETVFYHEIGPVKADPGQMEQVIMNLVVNARDAMPEGGMLTLETAEVELDETYVRRHGVHIQPGNYVMFAVSDTGTGMPPEIQDRVFEPFFTTKEKGVGTGLGLSTVYGIVKQSSGLIWCYSEPEQGTTFKIYLPRRDDLQSVHELVVEEPEDLRGLETVLVVEDEPFVRRTACKVLRRYGYNVLETQDGEEAGRMFAEHPGTVHLLLTDVVMPGMNGKELAEILTEQDSGLKVLFMSGYTDNAVIRNGVLDESMCFLQKPFSPERLARKVREMLGSE